MSSRPTASILLAPIAILALLLSPRAAAACGDLSCDQANGADDEAADDGTGGEPEYDLPYDVTCGCSTEGGAAPLGVVLGLGLLALLGPWRRRRGG